MDTATEAHTPAQEPNQELPRISPEPQEPTTGLKVDMSAEAFERIRDLQAEVRRGTEEARQAHEELRAVAADAARVRNELKAAQAEEPSVVGSLLRGAAWSVGVFAVGAGLNWLAEKWQEARTAPVRRVDDVLREMDTGVRDAAPPAGTAQ